MRFLFVTDTYPPDINGVARTLTTLACGLKARGHELEIITTLDATDTAMDQGMKRHTLPSLPLPGYPDLRIGFAFPHMIRSRLQRFSPHAIYVATESPMGWVGIREARRLGIPVASGFHTNFQTYLKDYSLPVLQKAAEGWLRHLHNHSMRTLTPSADTAAMLQSWGIRNVGILGRGVDTELFSPEQRSDALRRAWGADEQTPVALYVGRVAAEKNLELLVRAFATFRETHPDAPCVIVGDGPRLKSLQAEHPDLHYTGSLTGLELAQHYASADVFLFPSISETFGNVVLEAMSSGLLPVAYDYAAPHLLIRNGQNGFLADYDQESTFHEATRQAAAHWNHETMRQFARQTAHERCWQHIIQQFEQELVGITSDNTNQQAT